MRTPPARLLRKGGHDGGLFRSLQGIRIKDAEQDREKPCVRAWRARHKEAIAKRPRVFGENLACTRNDDVGRDLLT